MTSLVIPFAACNGFGRPIFGSLTDKITPRNAAFVDLGLIAVASVMLYMIPGNVAVYTLGFALLWGCLGGWLAIAPTATASFFGIKDNARNYGLVFTAYGAGAIIGSLLAGRVKDIFGAYSNVFLIVAVLSVVGIVVAFMWLKPPVKKPEAAAKTS
jgi:MFS transporter, OFA family, oxalate/formate antiporter